MSTRANILLKNEWSEIWLYRHSDGYPEGVHPTLSEFIQCVIAGKIRDNPSQSAGWLILFGAKEYEHYNPNPLILSPGLAGSVYGWKCGAYEPTNGKHGDIAYLYTVDFDIKTVQVTKISGHKTEFVNYSFEDYVQNGAKELCQ